MPIYNPASGLDIPFYNVVEYGADPTGTKDSTTAIAAALAATLTDGGITWIPPGDFLDSGLAPAISNKRLKISGAAQASKLTNTASTGSTSTCNLYLAGSNVVGVEWVEIADLFLAGNGTGGMGIYLYNVNQSRLTNLRVDGFTAPSGWGVGINLAQYVFSCLIDTPVITNCAYAGLFIQNVSNANQVMGGWIYNCLAGAFAVRILSANSNELIGTIIQGTGSTGQDGVELGGRNNKLTGCWIENNAIGVYANEPDSVIRDCFFSSNTTDIAVEASSVNLVVKNCHFDTTPVITIAAGSSGTVFDSCTGLTLASITDSSGGKYVVRNCPGVNPTGPQTAPTIPASGTALTNPFPFDCTVYVSGGTVSAIAVGGTATGLTSGAITVPAGESITLTYTAVPTWVWVGH